MPPSDNETIDLDALLTSAASTTHANSAAATAAATPAPATRYLVPGIDAFLGHGYDVFGEYASPNSVRGRIYDLPAEPRVDQPTVDQSIALNPEQISHAFTAQPAEVRLIYSRPAKVGYTDIFQSSIEVNEITSSDKKKVKWGLGADIDGGYGGFSGEIHGRFDTKSTQLSTTRCLQATFETIYWKLDLNNYSYQNPPPIPEEVKQDFRKRSIDELISKYGTHCLEEIGIGTKIVHSYTIDTSKFSRSIDVTAALKAKYQIGSFNAGLGVDSEYHDAAWSDRAAVSVKIFTYGTSDSQLAEITDLSQGLGQHPMTVLKQGWHNPTLIAFYQSSLRPLWKIEGLMSPEVAAKFAARYMERAQTEQGKLDMLFQGLQPVYLLGKGDETHKRYRLSRTPRHTYGGQDWKVENDGKPWQYLVAEPREGMVPLHELALNDDTEIVRYETDSWIHALNSKPIEGYAWHRTGTILGYVYDNTGPDARLPGDAVPVFAYYNKDGDAHRGIFYSFLPEIVWDKGQWKPLAETAILTPELRRLAQEQLDRDWNAHDDIYRFFHVKPTLSEIGFGYMPDALDNPDLVRLISLGIPHWFAIRPS